MDVEKALEIAKELKKRERFEKISFYDPYPYQLKFHATGFENNQRLLMAANRIGKSYCGAAEMSYHLTGLYPEWWEGRRFNRAITAWAGGVSNETTRDIVQAEMLGSPEDPEAYGTGAIPRDCIVSTERKPGVPNAKSIALIKHVSGENSALHFKAYEMGVDKWQGRSVDVVWLDEEPSRELYSQAVTRTLDRRGMVYMTFTPENGMTETVASFMNHLKKGQSLTNATWDDATEDVKTLRGKDGHLNQEVMEQILSAYSPHEREMRRYGRPTVGSGLIFPIMEDNIMTGPLPIEDHWPRIAAIDFGWDHPTAVVWAAIDTETDTFYVYDCYRASKASPAVHAEIIKKRPFFIPIVYPHDGNRRDSMGNPGLADQYRSHGCNFRMEHFTNPPGLGQVKGSNSVEEGLMAMVQAMEDGRFKVFNHLTDWFEEFRMYHRKEGKVVAIRDDLMSATRYAFQSQRFAVAGSDPTWSGNIEYRNYGIV